MPWATQEVAAFPVYHSIRPLPVFDGEAEPRAARSSRLWTVGDVRKWPGQIFLDMGMSLQALHILNLREWPGQILLDMGMALQPPQTPPAP
jgi:hypothetical protein